MAPDTRHVSQISTTNQTRNEFVFPPERYEPFSDSEHFCEGGTISQEPPTQEIAEPTVHTPKSKIVRGLVAEQEFLIVQAVQGSNAILGREDTYTYAQRLILSALDDFPIIERNKILALLRPNVSEINNEILAAILGIRNELRGSGILTKFPQLPYLDCIEFYWRHAPIDRFAIGREEHLLVGGIYTPQALWRQTLMPKERFKANNQSDAVFVTKYKTLSLVTGTAALVFDIHQVLAFGDAQMAFWSGPYMHLERAINKHFSPSVYGTDDLCGILPSRDLMIDIISDAITRLLSPLVLKPNDRCFGKPSKLEIDDVLNIFLGAVETKIISFSYYQYLIDNYERMNDEQRKRFNEIKSIMDKINKDPRRK